MDLKNKRIVLTGASSGIGRALAKKLSKESCRLVLLSRRVDLLNKLSEEIKSETCSIYTNYCDISDKQSVKEAFDYAKSVLGEIDVAIFNAGYGQPSSIENFNSAIAEETFKTNSLGLVYSVEQVLPDFMKRRGGIIVGTSSLADNRGYSGSGFYCASKAAATIFLEGLRIDAKKYNIKVLTVKPGFVRTPMTDKNKFTMPFLMEPERAAEYILNGIKKEKRIIQFPPLTAFGSKLIGLMPSGMYEFLSSFKKLE